MDNFLFWSSNRACGLKNAQWVSCVGIIFSVGIILSWYYSVLVLFSVVDESMSEYLMLGAYNFVPPVQLIGCIISLNHELARLKLGVKPELISSVRKKKLSDCKSSRSSPKYIYRIIS